MHLFYIFLSFATACALECYVTDLNGLQNGNLNEFKQDCRHLGLQGITENINLQCYKVVATEGERSVVLKGCAPKNGCGLLKTSVEASSIWKVTSCWECSGDYCNGGNAHFGMYGLLVVLLNLVL